MAFYQFYQEQIIPTHLTDLWDFISSPQNLKRITPEYMGFQITSKTLSEKIYPGMMISYKVRPVLNLPITWVTEITHIKEFSYFVDEQRIGPYTLWHHEHWVKEVDGKVLMSDLISYQVPAGFLGGIANQLFIKAQLKAIFEYRREVLEELFGGK